LRVGAFEIAYGEAWLLETAVSFYVPLANLAMSDEAISLRFNHPSHHMTRDELLRTLLSLIERGDLVGYGEVLGERIPTGFRARFQFERDYSCIRAQTSEYRRKMVAIRRWCRSIWDPAE
jgi:hypothetical protein